MRSDAYSIIRSMENPPSTAKIAGVAAFLVVSAGAGWYALSGKGGVAEISYVATQSGTEGSVAS